MSQDRTFSAEQAVRTQAALREALGLGPERFPLQAFVGMISDEIEQLREAGRSDAEIARLVSHAGGAEVSADDLQAFYATPEARGHR